MGFSVFVLLVFFVAILLFKNLYAFANTTATPWPTPTQSVASA